MQDNTLMKYIAPDLIQLARPSMIVAGLSNLNDPRDIRSEDDEWKKYEDTDDEI